MQSQKKVIHATEGWAKSNYGSKIKIFLILDSKYEWVNL